MEFRPVVAVGHTPAVGDGARLAGPVRGACAVADPKATHRAGVADRGRLHRRVPGADLSDAVVEADRPGTRPDLALSAGSRRRAGIAGGRRVVRPEPTGRGALAGRLAETRR